MTLVNRAWSNTLVRHAALALLGLVVVVIVLMSLSDFRNRQLTELAYIALAAGGLTVLTGINGQISLGHGAFMAIGAYTTALMLAEPDTALPLPLILLASLLVATAVVGALVGVAAARLHGPYLAGATLALAVGVPGLTLYFGDTLGGEQGINVRAPRAPDWFDEIAQNLSGERGNQNVRWLAFIAIVSLLVAFFLLANLMRSRMGRTWRAVRDQEVAAELAGISLGAWRITRLRGQRRRRGPGRSGLLAIIRSGWPHRGRSCRADSQPVAAHRRRASAGWAACSARHASALLCWSDLHAVGHRDRLRRRDAASTWISAQASQAAYVVYGLLLDDHRHAASPLPAWSGLAAAAARVSSRPRRPARATASSRRRTVSGHHETIDLSRGRRPPTTPRDHHESPSLPGQSCTDVLTTTKGEQP